MAIVIGLPVRIAVLVTSRIERRSWTRSTVQDLLALVVGSVCDPIKMTEVFSVHHPDIVFHAAARKHVPMMQYNPDEAILNNVGGTRTVAEASLASGTPVQARADTRRPSRHQAARGPTRTDSRVDEGGCRA